MRRFIWFLPLIALVAVATILIRNRQHNDIKPDPWLPYHVVMYQGDPQSVALPETQIRYLAEVKWTVAARMWDRQPIREFSAQAVSELAPTALPPRDSRWKPFLVRAVTTGYPSRQCVILSYGNTLFVHGGLTAHWDNLKHTPIIVYLNREPKTLYVVMSPAI